MEIKLLEIEKDNQPLTQKDIQNIGRLFRPGRKMKIEVSVLLPDVKEDPMLKLLKSFSSVLKTIKG